MTDANDAALIRALAAGLKPVAVLPPAGTRAWRLAGACAVVVASALAVAGVRRDIVPALGTPFVLFQLIVFAAVAAAAIVAALRLAVPGADRSSMRYLMVSAFALWPASLMVMHRANGGTWLQLFDEPLHRSCVMTIAAVSALTGAMTTMLVRRGAPMRPMWPALMAGGAGASVAAFAVTLSCPVSRLPHIAVSHLLPGMAVMAIVAVVSTVSGHRPRLSRALATVIACAAATSSIIAQSQESAGTAFTVVKATVGYVRSDEFLTFLSATTAPRPAFDGGPMLIGAAILLGGLLLNLTPCVLPMIPINLAIIGAGDRTTSRRRGWMLGAAYGGAMAIVYGVLGAVIVATAGTFGVINSSPWFNGAIAVLFVVLGLAMFDVVTLDFSRLSGRVGTNGRARGSVGLAFFMGGIAALLAGACVAPVVIQVVALASRLHAAGSRAALALPMILGIGMGLPWPFAGAGLASMPKPGAWMVRVKQGLGVCILLTAVYYGYEAASPLLPKPAAPAMADDGWYDSLDAGLAAAKREGKPVFLDVWATWCKNCVVMNATTFKDPNVIAALDGFVKVRFQAEDVERPDAAALLDRLDSVGLPTYAVVTPAEP